MLAHEFWCAITRVQFMAFMVMGAANLKGCIFGQSWPTNIFNVFLGSCANHAEIPMIQCIHTHQCNAIPPKLVWFTYSIYVYTSHFYLKWHGISSCLSAQILIWLIWSYKLTKDHNILCVFVYSMLIVIIQRL